MTPTRRGGILRPSLGRKRAFIGVGLLSLSVRLLTAGHGIVTVDEPTWMARSQGFFEAITHGRFGAASVPIGAPKTRPGVTTMWLGSIARFVTLAAHRLGLTDGITTPFERSSFGLAVAQILVAVACSSLIVLVAYLCADLLGRRTGIITGVLLAVEPFVVAHTVVLHTDGILALTLVASGLALLRAAARGSAEAARGSRPFRWHAIGGAMFGLALLTKVSALLYLPGLALPAVVATVRSWRSRGASADGIGRAPSLRSGLPYRRALAFAAALLATVLVLYPALWIHPVAQVRALIDSARLGEAGHPTYFRGKATNQPGLLYYPYVLILRASPVVLVGGVLGLLTTALRRRRRQRVAVIALMPVPYMAAISLASKQFDRYSLPLIVTMAIVAAVAIDDLVETASARLGDVSVQRPLRLLATGLAVVVVATPVLIVSPYPLAYFDPMAGGPQRAERTILVGWGEGLEQIGRAITADRHGDCEGVVTAVPAIHNYVSFPCGEIIPLRARVYRNLSDVSYAVSYIADDQRAARGTYFALVRRQGTLIRTVRIEGIRYAQLWRIDRPPPGRCADDRMAVPVAPRCG